MWHKQSQPVSTIEKAAIDAAQSTINNDGGTFDPVTLASYQGPNGAFQVALDKAEVERRYPLVNVGETATRILEYRDEFVSQLSMPEHHLGTWVSNGEIVVDVSVTIHGREEAMKMAQLWNQEEILDWTVANSGDWDNAFIPVEQEVAPVPENPEPPVIREAMANLNGVMVALYPPPQTAQALAVADGEPADRLHVTLAMLGDAGSRRDWDRAYDVVETVASSLGPLSGTIEGSGSFQGEEVAMWAGIEVQGLSEFRERLVQALEASGFPVDKTHDFAPHMTLKYGQSDEGLNVPTTPVTFSEISLSVGKQRYDIELGEPVSTVTEVAETVEQQPVMASAPSDMEKLAASIERIAARPVNVNVTMPEINLKPEIKVSTPDIHMPEIKMPDFQFPEIRNEITMPEIKMPEQKAPEIHNHIQSNKSPRRATASRDKNGKLVVEYEDES